jgi:hypothetical protein
MFWHAFFNPTYWPSLVTAHPHLRVPGGYLGV